MKKTRLAAMLSLSLMSISAAQSAQYQVVELPLTDIGQSAFPTDINNNGDVSVNIQNLFNPIIDVSLINFELQTLIDNLTDIEAAKAGDLNDHDYLLLYSFITSNRENQKFQQIAQVNSYLASENDATLLHGFDAKDDNGTYLRSTTTNVRGLNDYGYTVGVSQGGFYKLPYTYEDDTTATYVLNDFYTRAFVDLNGKVVELPPPATIAGGLSDAFDINANNQVVGYGTTEFSSETFVANVENCADETVRGDIPEASCLRAYSLTLAGNASQIAQRRGLIWQLDDQGNILSTTELGTFIEPIEDDTRVLTGSAVAINDNGIAVGEAPVLYKDTTYVTSAAAFFVGDQLSTINEDKDIVSSTATDINNADIAIGYATKKINGNNRRKFFLHDLNTNVTTYPKDFFLGSSSVAKSINNNGLVVGYGEVESSIRDRRSEGFLYNSNTEEFTDLKRLLACDTPYIIQQANAINDDNVIVATAVRKGSSTNIKGEAILDSDGNELQTDVVVTVKLVPIEGGSVESCEVVDTNNRDRQGASFAWLLLLAGLGVFFRKCKQH